MSEVTEHVLQAVEIMTAWDNAGDDVDETFVFGRMASLLGGDDPRAVVRAASGESAEVFRAAAGMIAGLVNLNGIVLQGLAAQRNVPVGEILRQLAVNLQQE